MLFKILFSSIWFCNVSMKPWRLWISTLYVSMSTWEDFNKETCFWSYIFSSSNSLFSESRRDSRSLKSFNSDMSFFLSFSLISFFSASFVFSCWYLSRSSLMLFNSFFTYWMWQVMSACKPFTHCDKCTCFNSRSNSISVVVKFSSFLALSWRSCSSCSIPVVVETRWIVCSLFNACTHLKMYFYKGTLNLRGITSSEYHQKLQTSLKSSKSFLFNSYLASSSSYLFCNSSFSSCAHAEWH